MDNKPSPEHTPASVESPTSDADKLAKRLGFVENDDLKFIRARVVDAFVAADSERARDLLLEYQLQGEGAVDRLQGREFVRGQLGLLIARANLYREAGNLEAFLNAIADAKDYAFQEREDEIESAIDRLPSVEIAGILSGLGEEFGFDDETVAEIATETYSQAFELAYGYLVQAGLDADKILAPFMSE